MRKIKSTALFGAFVAVASVGAISHEAYGTTVTSVINNIAKEMLPGSVTLPAPLVTPSVNYPSSASITLTLSGASFSSGQSYTIVNAPASTTCVASNGYGLSSVTFSNCSLSANYSYTITGGSTIVPSSSVVFGGFQGTSSIVLSYSSSVGNDTPSSATIAQVQQELSFAPISASTYYINPRNLSTFTSNSSSSASNSVVLSNNAFGNSTWSNIINVPDTISFLFTGIPSSVSSVSATDTGVNTQQTATPGNASATIGFTLAQIKPPFVSASSDTISFGFFNSGNIQPGTIVLSSITGIAPITGAYNYVYSSIPQNFINFKLGGTQIYIPDALAPDNNAIKSGYLTISMPSSASIASISILNTGVNCSVPSLSLKPTGITNVSFINLAQLPWLCPDITPGAWQSGVPLVINITGANATPNNITADAYAVFNGVLKRIPINVISIGTGVGFFPD